MKKLMLTCLLLILALAAGAADDFFKICESGTPDQVKAAIAAGADVNEKDKDGNMPLMHAMWGRKPEVIIALLKAGADVNAKGNGNVTPLMRAAMVNVPEIAPALIKAGAEANARLPDGRTALMLAAEATKFPEIVVLLIKAGNDVNGKDDKGKTPLMFAAEANKIPEVIAALVKAGADANAKDKSNRTPLMLAAIQNNTPEIVAALVKAGADVNAKDKEGKTPLMLAAGGRNTPEVVAELLKAGAEVNAKDNEGKTALRQTVCKYYDRDNALGVMELLLKAGADVNARDNGGWTPLMTVASHKDTLKIVEALIKAGAEVNAKNSGQYGYSSLMIKARDSNCDPKVISALIKAGAEVNAKDKSGWTPLMWAAKEGSAETVVALLKAGAEVNAKSLSGDTPLLAAVNDYYRDLKKVSLLIAAGADVNVKDKEGDTPLLAAAGANSSQFVEALLTAGAKVNVKDNQYRTPLQRSVADARWQFYGGDSAEGKKIREKLAKETQATITLLIQAGAEVKTTNGDESVLMLAARTNNTNAMALLLKAGAEANVNDRNGQTPLMEAVQRSENAAALSMLLEAGAKVNVKNQDDGVTPLMSAAARGKLEMVEILLDADADVNAKDNAGKTPLIWMMEHGKPKGVIALLRAGAEIYAKDKEGQTALMWAVRYKNFDIVASLIEAGADVNAKDKANASALDYARTAQSQPVIDALLKAGAQRGIEIATDDKNDIMPWWSLLPPVLQKTYLQPVPGQIVNAYCDYRGRMWYTVYQSTMVQEGCCVCEVSLAASIKAQVEKQWAGNQPVVIKGGEIALFEPGGRVWIVSGRELLGYDGHFWRKGILSRMESGCPGHGGSGEDRPWAVGNRCFFGSGEGIICFDNDRWVPLEEPAVQKDHKGYSWSLAGLRDETGLVAWNHQPNEAWVYRWGRWNRLTLPRELTEAQPDNQSTSKRPVIGIAVDAKNNLWILTEEGFFSMPLGLTAKQNMETLKKLTESSEPPTLNKITIFGPYQPGRAFRLSQEHNGTILIAAESMRRDGQELGGGLLIIDPQGSPRFVANRALAQANHFLSLDGKRLVTQGNAPVIIDLQQNELSCQSFDIPDRPFIQCVGSDGRYYLKGERYDIRHSGMLYALDPVQRDERPPISAIRVELQSDPYCVASDGSVWAAVEGKGLSRFRDGQWQVLVPLGDQPWIQTSEDGYKSRKEQVRALWAGTNGVVLAVLHDQTAILFNGDKQIKAKSVRDLVTENLACIAASFSKDAPRSVNNENNGITADRKGNIYVQEGHDRLSIYLAAEHRWEPVLNYDAARSPQVYGDGSKVLLFKMRDGLHEAFCETPTEFVRKPLGLSWPLVLDLGGGLFALESRAVNPKAWVSDYTYRILLLRPQPAVIAQEHAMPKAFDPAGILWTECFDDTKSNDSKPCTLRLFKADKRFQDIELADVNREGMCIVPDAAGSVYIWTTLGLRHYVLNKDKTRYNLDCLYRVTCDGRTMRTGSRVMIAGKSLVSSAGFSSSSLERPAGIIYLIPLPKERVKNK